MKKKILVCSVIAILLAITAFSTTAYFTNDGQVTNVITAGNVKIELKRWKTSKDGSDKAVYDGLLEVMPGKEIYTLADITNVGSEPAWLRVSVEKRIQLAEGKQGKVDLSLISLNFDTENWIEKDGYFYYREELTSGETAKPLYTKITFSTQMSNKYQDSKAEIDVVVEATQRKNNGENVMEAGGWPKR